MNISRPESQISIKKINDEVIIQDQKVTEGDDLYKITIAHFSDHEKLIVSFVDVCLRKGFNWALQHNHPKPEGRGENGKGRSYISFGLKYSSWDVGLDKLPINSYVINRNHRDILQQEQIPFWLGGGGNWRILPDNLTRVLDAIKFVAMVEDTKSDFSMEMPMGNQNPESIEVTVILRVRDPFVKGWVLREAKGVCECCGHNAPFRTFNGQPFLEVHHLHQLSDGGSDTINNCIAICPNCHRELHYGINQEALISDIRSRIKRINSA